MQTSVATLILVTATVMFAVIVVNYSVTTFGQFVNSDDNSQINRIQAIQDSLLNQTSILNNGDFFDQTTPEIPNELCP